MQRWYVVQVFSSQERKIKKSIDDAIISKGMSDLITEVLVPSENVSEVKRGQQRISEKRMWPGYLLIKMELTDDAWAFVKNVPGVIDFLGGVTPTPLSDLEIKNILQELDERKKGVVQKHKVEVGAKVKITDGVFINFIGTVIEVNHEKGRLSVLVSIFGRDTRVDDLEFWQVEQSSSETVG